MLLIFKVSISRYFMMNYNKTIIKKEEKYFFWEDMFIKAN